jgi:hypothetical protein
LKQHIREEDLNCDDDKDLKREKKDFAVKTKVKKSKSLGSLYLKT